MVKDRLQTIVFESCSNAISFKKKSLNAPGGMSKRGVINGVLCFLHIPRGVLFLYFFVIFWGVFLFFVFFMIL